MGGRGEPYGFAAALGRRWRVAHNPTGPTTAKRGTSDEEEERPSPYGRTPVVLSLGSTAWDGFKKLLVFVLLIRSKPRNWLKSVQDIIGSTERKSIYMRFMLAAALKQFHQEVNTVNERENLKALVATIRARRDLKKNSVGARIVGRVQRRLENAQYFAERKA